MKKNLFMVAAVALMALISCNKEEMNNGGNAQAPEAPKPSYYVEFTADIPAEEVASTPAPQSAATRTAYDATNKKTKWVAGDLISVNGKKFKIADGGLSADGYSARFINAEELGEDFRSPYSAVCPASAGTFDLVTIKSEQEVEVGKYDPASQIDVAYAENNSLTFKHLTTLIQFQVPSACSTVTIKSDNVLAGNVGVSFNDKGDPEYQVLEGVNEITVKVKGGGSFAAGKDYYVAVLPGVKANFSVRIDGYFSKGTESITINRTKVGKLNKLPEPLRKIYVKNDLNWSNLKVYAWDNNNQPLLGDWPGTDLSTSETVNSNSYKVYDCKTLNSAVAGMIVNGKATKSGSTKVDIQTTDITANLFGNKYYRLTMRENYYKEVDPNDLKTFGFRIYVYVQKGDSYIDPYLHVWNTNGIENTDWNNSQIKMQNSWTYPVSGGKTFYYYDPPTEAYASMNFIVTLNKGTKQTGNITGALKNDYYICAWADNSSSCGLYCNSANNNSITASNIIKNNPEACK